MSHTNFESNEAEETYKTFKKELGQKGFLKSPSKHIPVLSLRDFLSFSTTLTENYLQEYKRNKLNFKNLMTFLPFNLEKKFKYSTNNKAHITEFLTNFIVSLEHYVGTSKEVSLFSNFFLQENIPHKKLGFYLKARKSMILYLYYSKTQPGDLDSVELSINQWSTLTNRLFNEFSNFNEILKGVTDKVRIMNKDNIALQKKNTINAINLLEIWLDFFEKYKKCYCNNSSSPKKPSPIKEKTNVNGGDLENNYDSSNKSPPPSKSKQYLNNEKPSNGFLSPPNSYYKEMIERGEIDKEAVSNREAQFLNDYGSKTEDNNFMGKSMLNVIDCGGEKIGEFLKQDSNKFKVLNMILRMIVECEGLLQDFYEVIGFFKHLKDYVNYISKDKILTEKIKTFKLPNLDETYINKKINFCKKFIQEYITSLEYMTFSKTSFQDLSKFEKNEAQKTPNPTSDMETSVIININNDKKEPANNNEIKDKKEALHEIINKYLNELQERVLADVYQNEPDVFQKGKLPEQKIDLLPMYELSNKETKQIQALDLKEEPTYGIEGINQQPNRMGDTHMSQYVIKVNDKQDSLIIINEDEKKNKSKVEQETFDNLNDKKNEENFEKLKLGNELEGKINKIIFQDIKEEDLNFIQRKISQELYNKRHSVHYKTIKSGVSNISKIQKGKETTEIDTQILVRQNRRSSSIESFGSPHKYSNENTNISKFARTSKKNSKD